MKLIFDSAVKTSSPFFSICTEAHNREKTIYKVLDSVSNQQFGDFEYIFIDDCSTDKTLDEVNRFIHSDAYQKAPFPLTVYQTDKKLGGVKCWNEPLHVAKGKYIAVLEGDDYFSSDHLQKAYNQLSKSPDYGVYATGNQHRARPLKGSIKAEDFFKYTYLLSNISPPSETIFIRLKKNGEPFLYNITDYTYAPEIELLLMISDDGWNVFHDSGKDIYREPSTSGTNLTWKFFDDKFKLLEKYKQHRYVTSHMYNTAFNKQVKVAIKRYLVNSYHKTGKPQEIKEGIMDAINSGNHENERTLFKIYLLLESLGVFAIYFFMKKILNKN